MSELKLFHGTSFDIAGGAVLKGKTPLIGKRWLNDPGRSGTLTDDRNYAERIASRRGGDPIVLTYVLPESVVIDEGLIDQQDRAHGYVTNLEIELRKLPKAYLQAMLAMNRMNKNVLEMVVERGDLSFHAVPYLYLANVEEV